MLFLFRKLRRALMQKNKVTTYLLYALGEIFLVVIGIIIAVNINNWNELRKAKIQETKTLNELKVALNEDLVDIEFNINWHESAKNACEIILEHFDKNYPYNDSLDYHFGAMTRFSQFLPNLSTYEAIKANGFSIISNDSLRLRITHYYENEITYALGYEKINRSIVPLNLELHRKHFYMTNLVNSAAPKDFDGLRNDDEFISYLYSTKAFRQNESQVFQELKASCTDLIKFIDQVLETEK